MDYNDNESEGQHLQLTGEDSSKSSSVLRPFALPNFDFDDNIHGHLRFDSLVGNDVFLGIPSQEDNHWLEDFSRGSSGIVFSSSAAESCALPRHINVWSEATSTESVELLLKACGQEEMASGENMIEDTCPEDKVASSTAPIKSSEMDGNNEEVDNGHGLVPPDDQGDFSRLDQNVDVKYSSGCTSVPDETGSFSQLADGKVSELAALGGKLNVEIQVSSINEVETGDLAESLRNQAEENIPAPGSEIGTTKSSSLNPSASAGESVDLDKFRDTNLVSSDVVAVYVPPSVEESGEGSNKNDENMNRFSGDADNPGPHCSLEVPSLMNSSHEEHAVEISLTNTGICVSMAIEGQSTRDGGSNDFIAQDVKPPRGDEYVAPLVFPSSSEKQLSSGINLLDKTGPKMAAVTQSQRGDENCPGTNSGVPCASFTSSASHNSGSNSPMRTVDDTIKEHDASGSPADATVHGESLAEDSIMCSVNDSAHKTPSEKDNIESPSVDASTLLPTATKEDVHVMEHDDPACEQEAIRSLHDTDEICTDKEMEVGINITCNIRDQNAEGAAGSQVYDVSVANADDDNNKLLSPSLRVDDSIRSSEFPRNAALCNAVYDDQCQETESESSKVPKTLDESSRPNELACAVGTEGAVPLGSAESGGIGRNGCAQDDDGNVPSEKLIEEPESSGTISANIPDTGLPSFVARSDTVSGSTDTAPQVSAPNASLVGPSESIMSMDVPLEKNVEQIRAVLTTPSPVTSSSPAEESFTFDIRPLEGQSSGDAIKDSFSLNAEGVVSTSTITNRDKKMVKEISVDDTPVPDGSARKARRGGGRSGKGSVKRGNPVKETTPIKQNERDVKSSISPSPFGAGQLMTFSSTVPTGPVFIPTNLPDLYPSAQSSTIFQQPFTALQQVQLRAQIFVYGSLIQGVAPDEACMVSAFDGSKHIWEPAWRTCVDRFRDQKPQGNNNVTPVHLHSVAKGLEESNSQAQILSGSGQLNSKLISSANVFPLSSPFWSIATPSSEAKPSNANVRSTLIDHQAISSLNPFQSPAIRNFTPHSTFQSQNPFSVPWFASSQSSPFGISTNYSSFPITEPVKLTPVKGSVLVTSSGGKMSQTTQDLHTSGNAMFPVSPSLTPKKGKASAGQTSHDSKIRKRKKSSNNEGITLGSATMSPIVAASVPLVANYPLNKSPAAADASQVSLISGSNVNSLTPPVFDSHYSTSVAVAAPATFVPGNTANQLFSVGLPSVSHNLLNRAEQNKDRASSNADGFKKVEEANVQAQEAAAHASQAVNHCESVWNQLKHQMNLGLSIDVEAKLASAAAAIAASACVAKAAAAAANVALSAAVQAKLMAEEAVSKPGTNHNVVEDSVPSLVTNYGTSSVQISAAREAARRRIEAASAATRHAENLDAIVKAAELAAEAVSHTGKIVTMGDPFSMHELVKAGPENYWKVLNTADDPGAETDINKSKTINFGGMGLNHEGPDKVKVAESSKTAILVPESNLKSVINSDVPCSQQTAGSIKEGSMVEVFKEHGDQKKGWFLASIVSLNEMDAYVCYTELQSKEGSKLKEWISIKSDEGEVPKVRTPHPTTSVQSDGIRKRRRAAVKNYTWSVGDKVDAWLEDCWCEGIVVNAKDTTSVDVRFAAQGETIGVKLWHLRPTLVWTGGEWVEWCRPQKDGISQGDTPIGKRSKLDNAGVVEHTNFAETGGTEARMVLSADEKVFNIGRTSNENKPAMMTGKGGSRGVVFGVPKPGKKRKFMEVSKHYVSDKAAKGNVLDDSMTLSKLLTRHGSSRIGNEKGKQTAGSKATVPKFGKPPGIPSRSLKQKNGSSSSQANEQKNASDIVVNASVNDENESDVAEHGSSNIEEASGGLSAPTLENDAVKKASTKSSESDQLPAGGKVVTEESSDKATSHADEPRRSVRRIQPTSRLLEGIQSSLTTSKMPSSSHDKSHRTQKKGTTKGSSR